MNYIGTVIRPPSEADSIILQLSLGCSHNKCSFCGAYRDKVFQAKSMSTIFADIAFAKTHYTSTKSIFLADGDALALPYDFLSTIIKEIKRELPWITKISSYASPKSLLNKSEEQLHNLRELGLKRLYLGVETGSSKLLEYINKGVSREQMIDAGRKAKDAGFFLSTSVILGLGGSIFPDHPVETGKILSEIAPHHIAALSLLLVPNTELEVSHSQGKFPLLSKNEILGELKSLIEYINIDRAQFHANHASNHLALSGKLPRDKEKFTILLDKAIAGEIPTMPDYMRSL